MDHMVVTGLDQFSLMHSRQCEAVAASEWCIRQCWVFESLGLLLASNIELLLYVVNAVPLAPLSPDDLVNLVAVSARCLRHSMVTLELWYLWLVWNVVR